VPSPSWAGDGKVLFCPRISRGVGLLILSSISTLDLSPIHHAMASASVVSSRISPLSRSSARNLKRPITRTQLFPRSTVKSVDFVESFGSNDNSSRPSHQRQLLISCTRPYSSINSSTRSSNDTLTKSQPHQIQSIRNFTLPTLQCIEYTPTLFGLTPFLLTSFHSVGIPYYSGIALTNILVRSSMIPLVIQGAKTSLGIGVVAPEVQYLITNFTNDFRMLKKKEQASGSDELRKAQLTLVRYTVESLRGIFKLHKVNLLDIFKVRFVKVRCICF
jgi:membrane protein insertase Oxa1/YidC/SpoIIIJ